MKVLDTRLIQRQEGRKRGKYQILLEVTDYDLDMLEDLVTVRCAIDKDNEKCELEDKYHTWLKRTWKCFWQLWRRYPPPLDEVRFHPLKGRMEYIAK